MKLVIRALAVCVVLIGATAASLSSAASHGIASRQSATAGLPVPICGPWVPCQPDPPPPGGPSAISIR